MRLAIVQYACKWRQIHTVRDEVESLRGRHWPPLIGQEAGVDPRRNWRNSRRLAINGDLGLTEVGVSAGIHFIDTGQIIREAAIPLLVCGLALRNHVQIGLLDVLGQSESSGELVCRRKKKSREV